MKTLYLRFRRWLYDAHVRCRHCGERCQLLGVDLCLACERINRNETWQIRRWYEDAAREPKSLYACPRCGTKTEAGQAHPCPAVAS